jgi:hypothetical protein
MMEQSFDYAFVGPGGEKLTLRLHRARSSPAFDEDAYERIARMMLALHLSFLRNEVPTPDLHPGWQVTVHWVQDFDAPYDVDSLQVTEMLGRGRMQALAQDVKDPSLRAWLLQEADLTDVA